MTAAADKTLIIGPGRVGSTLAVALTAKGWPVAAIGGRRADRCDRLAARLGPGVKAGRLDELAGPFPVVLLAVVDDIIGEVAEIVARRGLADAGSVVMHLSGVHTGEALKPVADVGAARGSLHPLQTFPSVDSGLRALPGSHWFVEGDPAAVRAAERLVAALDGHCHLVPTGDKVLYHASASIACNLLTALLDASLDAAAAAGLERTTMLAALSPLVRSALENAIESGPASSLTGPISRGDLATVALHLRAVEPLGDLADIYRALGKRSVKIAAATGKIDSGKASSLIRCLDQAGEADGET